MFLVRHAAYPLTGRVLAGRLPGQSLHAAGRAQAEALAARLSQEEPRIAAVHCGPLERARETAAPIAARLDLTPEVHAALDEIDFGAWTGRSFDALAADPDWQRWNARRGEARPPGGESMAEAQVRAVRHVESLRDAHPDAGVVLVSHGDVIKGVLAAWLGLPLDAHDRFEVSPGSISALVLWPGGGRVLGVNEVAAAGPSAAATRVHE